MPYYPQFDPDRPTTPAEDFNDLEQEALSDFSAWLIDNPDTLEHIIDIHRDTRVIQTAVQAWSEEVKKERR